MKLNPGQLVTIVVTMRLVAKDLLQRMRRPDYSLLGFTRNLIGYALAGNTGCHKNSQD
jgi:hypothetical protein